MKSHPSVTRILLVEENEADFVRIRGMLSGIEGWHFKLDWVTTYDFALSAIQRRLHDVILLDYSIGPRTGMEFLREAESRGCRTPIVIITGQADRETDIQAMQAGAADYLVKDDTSPGLLERAIRHAIERRQAEDRILEQAQLLDLAQDAILVCDLNGRVQFWNKGAETLYGYTSEQVLNTDLIRDLHQEPRDFDQALEGALANGEWTGEMAHYNLGRKPIIVNSRWSLVYERQTERPRSLLIINTDITPRKRLAVQALRAQRLESICNLSTGIAHDLNNVLSPILMAVPLLKSRIDDPVLSRLIDSIEISTRRGTELVQQVQGFAHGAEEVCVMLQLKHLVTKAAEIAGRNFPHSIQVSFQADPDLWPILGDAFQLEEMIMDFVFNARDAMPGGGTLTLHAENRVIKKDFSRQHAEARVGDFVQLGIEDTGVGIAPEQIKKIFDPFYTTKEEGKGSGLGLSDALDIVKSHHGFILVESEPGRGSKFMVFLPRAETVMLTRIDMGGTGIEGGRGERILVVDDEPLILETTRNALETFGYEVSGAASGQEALKRFEDAGGRIDAVVTDMRMPVMNGAALIRELQVRKPELLFLGVSGSVEDDVANSLPKDVRMAFLRKPYTSKTLLNKLRRLLDGQADSKPAETA